MSKTLNFSDIGLNPVVITEISDLDDFLSKKLTNFKIPDYFPEFISGFPKSVQFDITTKLIIHIKGQKLTDLDFVWPSVAEFEVLVGKPENANSVLVELENIKSSQQQKKLADYIVKTSKNIICIPGNEIHPTYLINKKTNSVSIVNEKDSIISTEETKSHKVYILSPNITQFLELEKSEKPIRPKQFLNKSSLLSHFEKNSQTKGIVFFKQN